jgi:uncharacterized protein (DUF1778 family)
MEPRRAILLSCSKEESRTIHALAEDQRRTVSGYVLKILMRAITFEDDLAAIRANGLHRLDIYSRRDPGRRTTLLLRCSKEEDKRIRAAAKRRGATLSGFILGSLRCSWSVAAAVAPKKVSILARVKGLQE